LAENCAAIMRKGTTIYRALACGAHRQSLAIRSNFSLLESHFKVLGPIKPLHLRAPLADEPRPDHEQDRALSDAYATLTPRYRFRLPN
jgi:hypothetical protein